MKQCLVPARIRFFNRRYIKLIFTLLMIVLIGGCSLLFPEPSIFYQEFINVDIDIQPNGELLITETQREVFEDNTSKDKTPKRRYRRIATSELDQIQLVDIRLNGQVVPSRINDSEDDWTIFWQSATNPPEPQTLVLTYRVIGSFRVDWQTTEIGWAPISADPRALIKAARVKVHFPASLADKITAQWFGVPVTARQIDTQTLEVVTQQAIQPGESLFVKLVFPNDALPIAKPRWQKLKEIAFLLLPALVGLVVLLRVVLRLRRAFCPSCKRFTLIYRVRILGVCAIGQSQPGVKETLCCCRNCDYSRTDLQNIWLD